jgi:uncharacterized phage infection (PIP) family protein YhgE
MKRLKAATDGMQTLNTKVEGLTMTFGELSTKVNSLTTTVRDLSTNVKGQSNKVSEIKQTMTTKINDLNHTLTPNIDGLNTKIKDLLKAQGDLIKKVSCNAKLCQRHGQESMLMTLMTPMMMMLINCWQQCRYTSRQSELTTEFNKCQCN